MSKVYRKGAIGAMTDEYEKALDELKAILIEIDDERFVKINDSGVAEDFLSVRNIVLHMVRSGYAYANYIRKSFGNKERLRPEIEFDSAANATIALDNMFAYTVATFENRWLMTDDEMMATIIKTSWTTYDLEAIIEHAIVHILRHRLQIQKAIAKS
jgi:uncharacterized damage-inducible protein DinB